MSSKLLGTLRRFIKMPAAAVPDSPPTPEETTEAAPPPPPQETQQTPPVAAVTEIPVVRIIQEEEEQLKLLAISEEEGEEGEVEKRSPILPRFDIVRASRNPVLRSIRARTVRAPLRHPEAARVTALHMPMRTITSAIDKKADKLRRRQFAETTLGLPRNTVPFILRTLYPQFALERRLLLEACQKPRDERFMRLFMDYGRLVSVELWKEFTLADALVYEHDHGLFIALDAILVAYFHNLMTDLISLLAAEGRRRVTREDVHFVLRTLWPGRAAGRQSLARIFQ